MLHKETITPATLELLKGLMNDELLKDFFLVGRTALSLQIGHRISIDLDFFSLKPFDQNRLLSHLEKRKLMLDFLDRNTVKGRINEVAVDFITHAYPLVKEFRLEEGIRLASLEDIAAMKLNAIVGNGTRLKDFIDMAYLSSYLSLKDMLDAYEHKYSTRNEVLVLKALSYFNDVNHKEPIQLLGAGYQWEAVSNRIIKMIREPGKVFQSVAEELQSKEKTQKLKKGRRL